MKRDKTGRIIFTKEMKENYTILLPMMLPYHFRLLDKVFKLHGFNTVLLDTDHANITMEGLKSVHNDTCYPALLVIGQLIDAIKSGKYDIDKVAVMITQTGGGCRASNYIHLLRKGLERNNLAYIPVVSLNASGIEKNPGFKISLPMAIQLLYSVIYGDILMWLSNQSRPYEVTKGQTDALVQMWEDKLGRVFESAKNLRMKIVRKTMIDIVKSFNDIERRDEKRIKVGVVGEIYIKYARLGNNNLEQFLQDEGCEVIVPGLMDFLLYSIDTTIHSVSLYGGSKLKAKLNGLGKNLMINIQKDFKKATEAYSNFRPIQDFEALKRFSKGYVGHGNMMGEGWLLTSEMVEFCHMGVNNVVCTQPFGCLPNHIAGKGMIRKIKENYPQANIVAIDYDPGATRVNQENRIKLMLANAKK